MGESLRKIAEVFSLKTELFGEETEMVGIAEHLLKTKTSLIQLACPRETLHVPKRAGRQGPFLTHQTVRCGQLGPVAVDQRIRDQLFLDSSEGRQPTRVFGGDKPEQG